MAKRTTITVEIQGITKKMLAQEARKEQVKISAIVRWAINSYLAATSKQQVS